MPLGFPSIRIDHANPLHHLWCNNGTWWVHYTLHFDGRKRRIRRSLGTAATELAIRRRDELLDRLARDGEAVPERRPKCLDEDAFVLGITDMVTRIVGPPRPGDEALDAGGIA